MWKLNEENVNEYPTDDKNRNIEVFQEIVKQANKLELTPDKLRKKFDEIRKKTAELWNIIDIKLGPVSMGSMGLGPAYLSGIGLLSELSIEDSKPAFEWIE